MTLTEAAQIWTDCKRQLEELKLPMEAAAEVLKAHFRKTGKADFRGVISYSRTTYSALDTQAVKEHLGLDVVNFMVRRERESLSLLK